MPAAFAQQRFNKRSFPNKRDNIFPRVECPTASKAEAIAADTEDYCVFGVGDGVFLFNQRKSLAHATESQRASVAVKIEFWGEKESRQNARAEYQQAENEKQRTQRKRGVYKHGMKLYVIARYQENKQNFQQKKEQSPG